MILQKEVLNEIIRIEAHASLNIKIVSPSTAILVLSMPILLLLTSLSIVLPPYVFQKVDNRVDSGESRPHECLLSSFYLFLMALYVFECFSVFNFTDPLHLTIRTLQIRHPKHHLQITLDIPRDHNLQLYILIRTYSLLSEIWEIILILEIPLIHNLTVIKFSDRAFLLRCLLFQNLFDFLMEILVVLVQGFDQMLFQLSMYFQLLLFRI